MVLWEFRKLQLSLGYAAIKLRVFWSDLTFSSPHPCSKVHFWDDFSLYT